MKKLLTGLSALVLLFFLIPSAFAQKHTKLVGDFYGDGSNLTNTPPASIQIITLVTNHGYNVAGAGSNAVNGNYLICSTNIYGNSPQVILTNVSSAVFNMNQYSGDFQLQDSGTSAGGTDLYDTSGQDPVPGPWIVEGSTAPAPTVTLTNVVYRYTNYLPIGLTFTNTPVWVDPMGNDAIAAALGGGHIQQYPFGTIDGALLNTPASNTIVFEPANYNLKLQPSTTNETILAYDSAIYFGIPNGTIAWKASGNLTIEGGSWIENDPGEVIWNAGTLTNMTIRNATLVFNTNPFDTTTNLQTLLLDHDIINLSKAEGLVFSGGVGTTNHSIKIVNCTFTANNLIGAGGTTPGANPSLHFITISNATGYIANNNFSYGSNSYAGSGSVPITIGTNAYVTLGSLAFNQLTSSNGIAPTNVLQLASPPSFPVRWMDQGVLTGNGQGVYIPTNNLATMNVPDFAQAASIYTTNANLTFSKPINVQPNKFNSLVVYVHNTGGLHTVGFDPSYVLTAGGSYNVTNWSVVTISAPGNLITNAICTPLN